MRSSYATDPGIASEAFGAHDHDGGDGLELVDERCDQGDEVGVHEQRLVTGVIDDVDDLVGEEPDVDGVAHPPAVRRGPIQLVMTVVVPGERAHRVTVSMPSDCMAEASRRIRESSSPYVQREMARSASTETTS